jgi:predicted nucleic-acid-binding protein
MRAIDANVLVRLIARDDPHQTAASETFIRNGAWVSHLVLTETAWVLDAVYSRSAAQIATAIQMLLSHTTLAIQDADVVSLALQEFRQQPALGFSDCLVLAIARKAGHVPLGTFDRELARRQDTQRL